MQAPTFLTRGSSKMMRCAGPLLYVALSIWSTWPLAMSPASALPLGTLTTSTVPMFNVWTMWWNVDRIEHGFLGYWNAPIFHPWPDTFAFSEPMPATVVVAPITWATGSRILAYNLYLLASLVLNGVFAERLLRRIGVARVVAVLGGAAMLMLPAIHWQRDVVQLVALWPMLWTWTALLDLGRRPSPARGAVLGIAFTMAFFVCAHQALFLALLLVGCGWLLIRRWLALRTGVSILVAAIVAIATVGPIAWKMHAVHKRHEFVRTQELLVQLSLLPGDYTATTGRELVDFGDGWSRPHWRLSPGWLKYALAIPGCCFGLCRKRYRRWTLFLLATGVLSVTFSFGVNLSIADWRPWTSLAAYVPGYSQVRNAFRFAFFVQMVVLLLGCQALHAAWIMTRRRFGIGLRVILSASVLGLATLAVIEVRPDDVNLAEVPDVRRQEDWIEFLSRQTGAIACVPFASGNTVDDFESTTNWMYFGTYHGRPMVNGYSGFFPEEFFRTRDAVNAGFPTQELLQQFHDQGVAFVVVDPEFALQEMDVADDSLRLAPVFTGRQGVTCYRIVEPE